MLKRENAILLSILVNLQSDAGFFRRYTEVGPPYGAILLLYLGFSQVYRAILRVHAETL